MKTTRLRQAQSPEFLKVLMRTLIFLLTLGLFGQAMCSKGDDPEPENDDPIVGTWEMITFQSYARLSIGESQGTIEMKGRDMEDVLITFSADGTTTNWGNTFIHDLILTIDGHSTTTEIETEPPVPNGTWRRKGDMLYVNHPVLGEQEMEIDLPSENHLMLAKVVDAPVPLIGIDAMLVTVQYQRVD